MQEENNLFSQKLSREAYEVDITIIAASESDIESRSSIGEIASTLSMYSLFGQNSLRLKYISQSLSPAESAKRRQITHKNILTTSELA